MIKKVLITSLMCLLAHSASAFYAGVSVGSISGSFEKPSSSSRLDTVPLEDKHVIGSIGHAFPVTKFLSAGLNVSYSHALNGKYKNSSSSTGWTGHTLKNSMAADAQLHWHFSPSVDLFALAGIGQVKFHFDHWPSYEEVNINLNGIRWGAGAEAKLSNNVSLVGQATFMHTADKAASSINNPNAVGGTAVMVDAGVRYNF